MSVMEAPARVVNPTAEDAYWREALQRQAFYRPELSYDDYSPALRVGYTGPVRRGEHDFAQVEPQLCEDWKRVKGRSRLSWPDARPAARAAWNRACGRAEHPA